VLRSDGSTRPVYEAVKVMPELPILPPDCEQGRFSAC
jgi:hypothetical protein